MLSTEAVSTPGAAPGPPLPGLASVVFPTMGWGCSENGGILSYRGLRASNLGVWPVAASLDCALALVQWWRWRRCSCRLASCRSCLRIAQSTRYTSRSISASSDSREDGARFGDEDLELTVLELTEV